MRSLYNIHSSLLHSQLFLSITTPLPHHDLLSAAILDVLSANFLKATMISLFYVARIAIERAFCVDHSRRKALAQVLIILVNGYISRTLFNLETLFHAQLLVWMLVFVEYNLLYQG